MTSLKSLVKLLVYQRERWLAHTYLKGAKKDALWKLSLDQSDYSQIKESLLTNFDLTKRSFRKKFRDCRPEKAETFRQFSGRLANYLDKWLGLAKFEKTYEAVCDILARDKFLDCCSHELYLHLKVSKGAKIRSRYNQVPHPTKDTNGKVTNSQLDTTNESLEVSPFPAGDHKAHINRRPQRQSKHKTEQKHKRSTKEVPPWYVQ